jgi:4-nitrophenyl phosphatase
MSSLPENIKSLILDMDGVIWKSETPIGDLSFIFKRIREQKLKVSFATNNSTRTPEQYVERLTGYGIDVESWQVITSALAVAELVEKAIAPDRNIDSGKIANRGMAVYAIGEAGVMDALRSRGIEPLPIGHADEAQAVVMGFDRQINFDKMVTATLLVRKGIPFFATNPDKTYPTPMGEIPGAGAWISVVITATGVIPVYAGKPSPTILEFAREKLGTAKEDTLVVGDRLETDIAGGQAAGMPTALVLSGVSTRTQGVGWIPSIDVIVDDLGALIG